jgi:hypothetical protein
MGTVMDSSDPDTIKPILLEGFEEEKPPEIEKRVIRPVPYGLLGEEFVTYGEPIPTVVSPPPVSIVEYDRCYQVIDLGEDGTRFFKGMEVPFKRKLENRYKVVYSDENGLGDYVHKGTCISDGLMTEKEAEEFTQEQIALMEILQR